MSWILETQKPIDPSAVGKAMGKPLKSVTVGAWTLHVTPDDMAMCVVSPRMSVGGKRAAVTKILQRTGGPVINDQLKASMDEADFGKPIACAIDLSTVMGRMANPMMPPALTTARGLVLEASISSAMSVRAVLLCKDAQAATDLQKMVDGQLALVRGNLARIPSDQREALESLSVSHSGSNVIAKMSVNLPDNMPMGGFPRMPFGFPGGMTPTPRAPMAPAAPVPSPQRMPQPPTP